MHVTKVLENLLEVRGSAGAVDPDNYCLHCHRPSPLYLLSRIPPTTHMCFFLTRISDLSFLCIEDESYCYLDPKLRSGEYPSAEARSQVRYAVEAPSLLVFAN